MLGVQEFEDNRLVRWLPADGDCFIIVSGKTQAQHIQYMAVMLRGVDFPITKMQYIAVQSFEDIVKIDGKGKPVFVHWSWFNMMRNCYPDNLGRLFRGIKNYSRSGFYSDVDYETKQSEWENKHS